MPPHLGAAFGSNRPRLPARACGLGFCGAAPSRRPSRLSKTVGLRRAVPTSSGGRDANPHFDNAMICAPLSVMVVTEVPEVIDWSGAEVGKFYRPPKKPVTMRLDADVVEWLKSYGPGYQTKANMLLRHAMHSTQAAKSGGKRRRA